MADDFIQVANDGPGKKMDTTSLAVGLNTVHRERVNLSDPTDPAAHQAVVATQPSRDAYGGVTRVLDQFIGDEILVDQVGADAVLTFTFSAAVDMIVILSKGAISRGGLGGDVPTLTKGFFCDDTVPTYVPVTATVVKVYAPLGATVSVWGYRY